VYLYAYIYNYFDECTYTYMNLQLSWCVYIYIYECTIMLIFIHKHIWIHLRFEYKEEEPNAKLFDREDTIRTHILHTYVRNNSYKYTYICLLIHACMHINTNIYLYQNREEKASAKRLERDNAIAMELAEVSTWIKHIYIYRYIYICIYIYVYL
jgi:hypothetical protein